jgi:hypothetical protein
MELHHHRGRRQERDELRPDYLLIESGFTLTQWLLVGPLTVLVLRRAEPLEAAHA